MRAMRHALFRLPLVALAMALLAGPPARAEDDPPTMMERGAEMFFQGLMQEMQPALDDFSGMAREFGPRLQLLLREMGPALTEILGQIDDIGNYEPPAFLPNGDIILRRSPDAPPFVPPSIDGTRGEIDL